MSINIDQKNFPKKILKTAPSEFIPNFFRKRLRPLSEPIFTPKKFYTGPTPPHSGHTGGYIRGDTEGGVHRGVLHRGVA